MRTIIGVVLALLTVVAATAAPLKHCSYSNYWTGQTEMVADINPGPADAINVALGGSLRNHFLAAYNGALYFQANDGKSGEELWRVARGAPSQVADLWPGPQGSAPHSF